VILHPLFNIADHVAALAPLGVIVSPSFLKQIFCNWQWSWKKPTIQHINKYTPENVRYYERWVSLVPHLPFDRLKFCDELHFLSHHLHQNRVIGPINAQQYLHDTADIADSFSLTLLDLSNQHNPFFLDLRVASNTEWDFLTFVCYAITAGWLQRGDFFIVDNASIHFGGESLSQAPPLTVLLFAPYPQPCGASDKEEKKKHL